MVPEECVPMRMYISVICCLGVILSFMLRFCISLCILRMVTKQKHRKLTSDCFQPPVNHSVQELHDGPGNPEFDWSESEQGYVLSSIFFTYFLFQIPAGYFTDMIGAVPISTGGMLVTGLISIITPEVARLSGWVGVVVLRLILGAGQALLFIPLHAIVNAWIPRKERGTWGAIVFSGSHFGSFLNMICTGQLLRVWTWPWIFRLYGVLGLVWTAVFLFTCYSFPDQCNCMSEKEKNHLEESGLMERKKHTHPPWLKILLNPPLWASVAATFGHGWVLFSLMTDLPKFMKSVMHISLNTNSLVNGFMYILIWINAIASGFVVDFINKKKWVSLSWNRKIFVSVSSVPPALGLVWSVYTNCNIPLAIAVILIGCSLLGYFYSSGKLVGIDMAPHYSGTVSAIVNALGTSAGFVATNVAGQLTPNEALREWRMVMLVALAVMVATNIIYVIWGSAEVQPYDNPEAAKQAAERKEKKNEEKQRRKEDEQRKKEEKHEANKMKAGEKQETDQPNAAPSTDSKN